jgi:hypothetical protein
MKLLFALLIAATCTAHAGIEYWTNLVHSVKTAPVAQLTVPRGYVVQLTGQLGDENYSVGVSLMTPISMPPTAT